MSYLQVINATKIEMKQLCDLLEYKYHNCVGHFLVEFQVFQHYNSLME